MRSGCSQPVAGAAFPVPSPNRPTVPCVSIRDQLPEGSFLRAEPGYVARQRVPIDVLSQEEVDAAVIAAGGRIRHAVKQSQGVRPGRLFGRMADVSWYEFPEGLAGGRYRVDRGWLRGEVSQRSANLGGLVDGRGRGLQTPPT